MLTKIKKRDGREVVFDIDKVANAIFKALSATGGKDYNIALKLAEKVSQYVDEKFSNAVPGVEDIQDTVEKVLIESGRARTAKEFILYRADRTRAREMNTRLMKVFEDITFKDKDNAQQNESGNVDTDTAMGTMLKYGSEGAKQFYEMYVLNPLHLKAHKEGDINIHDLDFLTLTTASCQIDLIKLFNGGFGTGNGKLREPNSINSYAALACIAIQSNQNDQHGGQSIPNFDYAMAPGVAKTYVKMYIQNLSIALELLFEVSISDINTKLNNISKEILAQYGLAPLLGRSDEYTKIEAQYLSEIVGDRNIIEKSQDFAIRKAEVETEKATHQAMEALVHNLNTMQSRAGAQIPISTINYGMDTSAEGRMVIRNLLMTTESGLGDNETPIYPIQIFRVKEGSNYNPEDPNYDLFKLACRVSSKRLFPNFSFVDAPYNLKYYIPGRPDTETAYMGCRTRVIAKYKRSIKRNSIWAW